MKNNYLLDVSLKSNYKCIGNTSKDVNVYPGSGLVLFRILVFSVYILKITHLHKLKLLHLHKLKLLHLHMLNIPRAYILKLPRAYIVQLLK